MAFGMEILTTEGFKSVSNLRTLREVYRDTKTTSTGSQAIPGGADSTNSLISFVTNDGLDPPQFSWSGSTLSWSEGNYGSDPTANFELVVFLYR